MAVIPVNKKLCEILLQLHISEKSGRGVPRIVREYGQEAFSFRDNAIVVTIPFNRLDLGNEPQAITQVMTQVSTQGEETESSIEQKIIQFCSEPKSTKEIAAMLRYMENCCQIHSSIA